jgi:hypothetical protein
VEVARLFESVNDGDIGMVQRGEGLGFPLEAREPVGVVCECLGQDLDRDVPVQLCVAGTIHPAHGAFTDLGGDLVRTDAGPRSQGHQRAPPQSLTG